MKKLILVCLSVSCLSGCFKAWHLRPIVEETEALPAIVLMKHGDDACWILLRVEDHGVFSTNPLPIEECGKYQLSQRVWVRIYGNEEIRIIGPKTNLP